MFKGELKVSGGLLKKPSVVDKILYAMRIKGVRRIKGGELVVSVFSFTATECTENTEFNPSAVSSFGFFLQ
jgi:hypothetical protein